MEADRFSGKGTMVRLLGFALSGKMFTGPGKISSVTSEGKVTGLVTGFPGYGDHFNNQLAPGPDGKIYFGQGAATSSGVLVSIMAILLYGCCFRDTSCGK